jgi:hypothetical protein
MKLFRVFSSNDYGKPIEYMGVFRGEDRKDALMNASKHYENNEISTTGFYSANEIDEEQLLMEKEIAVIEMVNKFEIFN